LPGCIAEDLNGSGSVDGADLGLVLAAWGPAGGFGPADFNGSGVVDGADLGLLLAAWGPVPLISCTSLTSASPESGPPGTQVKFTGTFPVPDPTDYCMVALADDGTVIPFEVISVSPDSLVAVVGPYPPNAQPAAVMIGLGEGTVALPDGPPGAAYGETPWSWAAAGPGVMSSVVFSPVPQGAPIGGSFFGTLVGGDLCVTITGDCPVGTSFQIWPRAHHYGNGTPNDPYVGYDCYIPCVEVTADLGEVDCATFICDVIKATYLAHVPPIVIDCTVTPVVGGTKLTLSLPGLAIDWGMFNIVTLPPNSCVPAICNPNCPCDVNGDGVVNKLDLFALEMLFGTVCQQGQSCCGDLNGDLVINEIDIQLWLNTCVPGRCNPGPCDSCDINGDGAVNGFDRDAIIAAFGNCAVEPCCADINGDGVVDGADLQFWLANCK